MKQIVIYHGACRDGWCAAWCAWRFGWNTAEFHSGVHGQGPPDVTGCDVLIVDFSYPRAILDDMALRATHLQVLDHHKTAEEALRGASYATFDLNRSGAGLAWDTLAPPVSHSRPWLVDYVEDRDLWRHALPMSEEVNAYIATLEFDFEVWEKANASLLTSAKYLGEIALAKTQQYVREVRKNARTVTFEGRSVPMVNVPQVDISEVLDSLVTDTTFAMGWWQRADGSFNYSLRSRGNLDVSVIAKKYGGGGHKNSAGFQLPEMLTL